MGMPKGTGWNTSCNNCTLEIHRLHCGCNVCISVFNHTGHQDSWAPLLLPMKFVANKTFLLKPVTCFCSDMTPVWSLPKDCLPNISLHPPARIQHSLTPMLSKMFGWNKALKIYAFPANFIRSREMVSVRNPTFHTFSKSRTGPTCGYFDIISPALLAQAEHFQTQI